MIETPALPAVPDPGVNLVLVYNPFDPTDRKQATLDWQPGKPMSAYLDGLPAGTEWVVYLNTVEVKPERWGEICPAQGDYLIVMPVPRGGGGGGGVKNIFRMILLVALVVVTSIYAPGLGAALADVIGISAAAATAIVSAVIVTAGSLLINGLLAPRRSLPGRDPDSFGIEGPKNTSAENVAVSVVAGRFRVGGNRIATYVTNSGDTQYLHLLYAVGEGPIAGIENIRLNGQPIENYDDVEWQVRLGTADQEIIPWFASSFRTFNRGVKLEGPSYQIGSGYGEDPFEPDRYHQDVGNDGWVTHTTEDEVDQVRLDFIFPNGLMRQNRSNRRPVTVGIEIQYRALGTENWQRVPDLTVTAERTTPVRRSQILEFVSEGRYEIRVRRTSPDSSVNGVQDDVYLTDVVEIVLDPVRYIHTALLGIRIRLNDQLNNIPEVTCDVRGLLCRSLNDAGQEISVGWTDNPAWIALECLMNRRFGGGLILDRIDTARFQRWADICDEMGLTFNGVIQGDSNVWDALQPILRAGRAQLVHAGVRYSLAFEIADEPVMMFGAGNIKKGTFRIDWLPLSERANEVEATFFDGADDFREHTIRLADSEVLNRGEIQRTVNVPMIGITNRDLVWRELHLMMAMNRYIRQTVTFEAPIESIACTVGDQILVQHDMPFWGYSGRLEGGTTARVILDRPVQIQPGVDYRLLVLHSAVRLGTAQIVARIGRTILIPAGLPQDKIRRLVFAGQEVAVGSVRREEALLELHLSTDFAVSVGDTVEVWSVDMIDEVPVIASAAGEVSELDLAQPLRQTPERFANYMFGELQRVKKPFRVRRITLGSDDFSREITALEYNEAVYRDPANPPPLSGPVELRRIDHVRNLTATVEPVDGRASRYRAAISWTPPSGPYAGADVHVARPGEPFELRGQILRGGTSWTGEIADIETVTVKVVAFDLDGVRAGFADAPTLTIDAPLAIDLPQPPSNLRVTPFLVRGAQQSPKLAMRLEWDHAGFVENETGFDVWFALDDGEFTPLGRSIQTVATIWDAIPGRYTFRIVAYDRIGRPSLPLLEAYDLTDPSFVDLAFVTRLELRGRGGSDQFIGRDAVFDWRGNFPSSAYDLGEAPFAGGGGRDPLFRRYVVRIYEPGVLRPLREDYTSEETYTYTYERNLEDGGPRRRFELGVAIQDVSGRESRETRIAVENPPPQLLPFDVLSGVGSVNIRVQRPSDPDFFGFKVWITDAEDGLPSALAPTAETTSTQILVDGLRSGVRYRAQLQPVDAFGSDGAPISDVFVFETRRVDTEDIAEDALDESRLTETFRGRLNAIDQDLPGSLYRQILDEADARVQAIQTEAQARATALLNEAQARGAAIATVEASIQSVDRSLASQVTTITASLNTNAAAIQTERTARANAISAEARAREILAAQVNDPNTGLSRAFALIDDERRVRTDAIAAEAARITALQASFNDPVNGLPAAFSRITNEQNARTTAIDAQARRIEDLSVQINDPNTGLVTSLAQVRNTANAASTATSALSLSLNELSSAVNNPMTGLFSRATVTQLNEAINSIADPQNGLVARSINELSTRIGQDYATIRQVSEVKNNQEAQWYVKTDVNGHVAGFGLATTPRSNGQTVSEFIVNATVFAVAAPGTPNRSYPFLVTTIDGQQRVVINSVVIGDATINSGHIRDMSFDKLTGGRLGAHVLEIGGDRFQLRGSDQTLLMRDAANIERVRISPNGLIVRAPDGSVVLDANGVNGAFVRNLTFQNISGDTIGSREIRVTVGGAPWPAAGVYIDGVNARIVVSDGSSARAVFDGNGVWVNGLISNNALNTGVVNTVNVVDRAITDTASATGIGQASVIVTLSHSANVIVFASAAGFESGTPPPPGALEILFGESLNTSVTYDAAEGRTHIGGTFAGPGTHIITARATYNVEIRIVTLVLKK